MGDVLVQQPLILGHEFGGVVEAIGPDALDGHAEPLLPGMRVAVDPAQPCHRCPMCEQGHPNLCRRLHFCGNYPDGGSLGQWITMPAHSGFPVPDRLSDDAVALLEPLGVALHTIDLARIRVGDRVAVLGAGCIGLCILQLARLAGADTVCVTDPLPWRLALADQSAQQAAEMVRLGGRIVITGISEADELKFKHSTIRRKGLTLRLVRRLKHVYSRAIRLVQSGRVNLSDMVSHRFALSQTPEAFALNASYGDQVVKIIIDHTA